MPALDPVFSKGTPLPTEKTVKYRATHALIPDKPDSDLAIKLWEGEFLDDPDANEWVGNVLLEPRWRPAIRAGRSGDRGDDSSQPVEAHHCRGFRTTP